MKTIKISELSTLRMGDGKGKPTKIVHGDVLKEYVGIGWVDVRTATEEDKQRYPELLTKPTRKKP